MELPSCKAALRRTAKKKRDALSVETQKAASLAACETLYNECARFPFVLSYCAFRSELDLTALNERLSEEKRLLLPRVQGATLTLHLATVDTLQRSPLGILEPQVNAPAWREAVPVALVPALLFDREGYRLGYGKGHFDKLLAKGAVQNCFGVGFTQQLTSEPLPREAHDEKLSRLFLF